ncbi:MAG: hypothetical protein PHG58_11985 [Clostridia bacterium]|nr:hypothetical protein [Clostridia bacterium]
MSDNPNYYAQEGQPLQRPIKKRGRRFIKTIAILLVISILSMIAVNYFIEPVLISRLTKGNLFGFHTPGIAAEELKNQQTITKPADKEIRDFGRFAKKLSTRFYLSLTREEKEDFQEIKDGAKQITAFLRGAEPVQSSTDTNTTALGTQSFFHFNLVTAALGSPMSLSVKAKNSGVEDEKELYDPEVLNDISVLLYSSGYPELAAAVTSMVAADYPENPVSALNFGTILRETNADEDAFNVLQYALRMSPSSEPILYSLGMCALDLGNTSYAQTCFSKILSLNASSGPGHQGMMLCYMDTENYSSAFKHMIEGAREGYTTMVTVISLPSPFLGHLRISTKLPRKDVVTSRMSHQIFSAIFLIFKYSSSELSPPVFGKHSSMSLAKTITACASAEPNICKYRERIRICSSLPARPVISS